MPAPSPAPTLAPTLAGLQRSMIDALCRGGPAPADAGGRFDLYRRSYAIRLLDSLREMHPALRHLLGDELFDAIARDYLDANPPSSYTLFDLDAGFAAHLAATAPDDPRASEPWAELLIDVVRFERAFLEVYDGPGVEGGRTIPSARDVPVGTLTVVPVPCARLLASAYPVGDYVAAVRRGERPALPSPAPTYLALVRRNYVVDVVALDAGGFAALTALFAGADSVEAAAQVGVPHETVRARIAGWADQCLFAQVEEITCC